MRKRGRPPLKTDQRNFNWSAPNPPGNDDITTSGIDRPNPGSKNSNTTRMTVCIVILTLVLIGVTIALIIVATHTSSSEYMMAVPLAFGTAEQAAQSNYVCPKSVRVTLPASLESLSASIHSNATSKGSSIPWSQYDTNPATHSGRRVLLSNSDFTDGTVRIRTPGVFVLTENVVFEPRPGHDHFPDPSTQPAYTGPAYVLGFFAAITVEAPSVVIDLNGHSIQASPVFALQQRFMSIIELAAQPFVLGQGPASFGGQSAPAADGLVIENGILGRSSHHGIHGNGCKRVLLRNVHLVDYEVAAVALNGCKDVVFKDVSADGSFTQIPVLGTYSNARFLRAFAQRVASQPGIDAGVGLIKRNRVASTLAAMEGVMADVLADVAATGSVNETAHPAAYALFANPTGLDDGTSYGFLFHPLGVAVGPFWHRPVPQPGSPEATERVLLQNCTIARTRASVVEVVALAAPDASGGGNVRGPAGDVLRIIDNADKVSVFDNTTGDFVTNVLAAAQVALMNAMEDVADEMVRKQLFGTTNGGVPVVEWADGTKTLHQLVEGHNYTYKRNGDTMFHVNKGVVALRIDGARDVCVISVDIAETTNTGQRGNISPLPGETGVEDASYVGGWDGGHPQQGAQYGYMGADTRGIGISGSTNVGLAYVRINGVHSAVGYARGLDVFNSANGTHIGLGCSVSNVSSGATETGLAEAAVGEFDNGPRIGTAIGLSAASDAAGEIIGALALSIMNVTSSVLNQALNLAIDSPRELSVDMTAIEAENTYEL